MIKIQIEMKRVEIVYNPDNIAENWKVKSYDCQPFVNPQPNLTQSVPVYVRVEGSIDILNVWAGSIANIVCRYLYILHTCPCGAFLDFFIYNMMDVN